MIDLAQFPCTDQGKAVSVLLISDCGNLSQKMSASFQQRSIPVHCHCLETFPDVKPEIKADLVILDTGFQVRKGLSLLREMKSICAHVPVLFITEKSSEEHVIAAFRLGARDYFTKPVNISHFMETVEHLLRVRKTCREKRQPLNAKKSEVLSSWVRARTDIPASFVKLLQYMNDHLTDEISLNALAETAGMSRHHFCRTFKKHMGSTPMQTLHFMRVERAKNLIRSGHYTISMVAMESGFNDIGTFMRHFKKITGITATDFRNTFRPKN